MAHFQCPFCNQHQAITGIKTDTKTVGFEIVENAEGPIGARLHAVACANPKCLRTSVDVLIGSVTRSANGRTFVNGKGVLFAQRVLPTGVAKQFPAFIPAALLEDYREACLIVELSPKAAATLVRRCLQGMIRDFCKITKARLVDEIKELKALVEAEAAPKGVSIETVEAIDHVRGIGNIGAHMEKDIDQIIPVEPNEAVTLIELVEMLFEEWYIARQRREDRLAQIKGTAKGKEAIKAGTLETPKADDPV